MVHSKTCIKRDIKGASRAFQNLTRRHYYGNHGVVHNVTVCSNTRMCSIHEQI